MVVDLLRRVGIKVDMVSISDSKVVTGSHGIAVHADMLISEVDFNEYELLVLPGGMPGTINLGECDVLCSEVIKACEGGKKIAAICAAPGIFAELGLLKDIPATCNPSRDELLKESGARLTHDKVVVSGNIITSRAMGTAIPFGLAIVAHYLGENTARALGENILYYNA
jgi:4-methyl-5(b-hydroxyethyl)-thiazole monophosphate biosynthesis